MNTLSFFTPVCYERPQTFREYVAVGIENYFYFGGKYAYVISKTMEGGTQTVVIKNLNQSKTRQVVLTAIKVVSYVTIALPLLAFALKVAFRAVYKFQVTSIDENPIKVSSRGALADLMERFTAAWDDKTKLFDFPEDSFNRDSFVKHLIEYTNQFQKNCDTNQQCFGYIDKIDLDPSQNPKIYMRADLHGDLKSLIENIRCLKQEGLLDENFKCRQGVHLVFLGDYCDRGIYGTQILEILMRLREENPGSVHLIRGNHEDIESNVLFGVTDVNLLSVADNKETKAALQRFYETMSLTTYFSLSRGIKGGKREYIQCTHGLFELTMDPAPLLEDVNSRAWVPVPKKRELSERIKKIVDNNSPLFASAQRIQSLVNASQHLEEGMTMYNWADVNPDYTRTYYLGDRSYSLSAEDVYHYLNLSSEQHRVMMLFRGHEHQFQHLTHGDKVLVTTLPVGMDCPGYNDRFSQPDRAYIITPKSEGQKWSKRAILRNAGCSVTTVTEEFDLTSNDI